MKQHGSQIDFLFAFQRSQNVFLAVQSFLFPHLTQKKPINNSHYDYYKLTTLLKKKHAKNYCRLAEKMLLFIRVFISSLSFCYRTSRQTVIDQQQSCNVCLPFLSEPFLFVGAAAAFVCDYWCCWWFLVCCSCERESLLSLHSQLAHKKFISKIVPVCECRK